MDIQENDKFLYYEKRIKELDGLLKQAQSKTLIDLIEKAKTGTQASLEKLIQIQKSTAIYLATNNIKNKKRIKQFSDHLKLCQDKIEEFKTLTLSTDLRRTLNDFYVTHLSEIQKRLKLEADINSLTINAFSLCAKEFDRILLQLVFKPVTGKFNYETIIDILNYIATKLIPGLDEIKMVSSFPVSIRKKQFAKTGDKILTYIEQYIDVIEKWRLLGDAYIKIAEE